MFGKWALNLTLINVSTRKFARVIIENMNDIIRQVCRNVKRWQDGQMALRWTAAAMLEAAKGFRRLKAYEQLPILRTALAARQAKNAITPNLEQQAKAA